MKYGLTLGKFLPFHKGHEFLIRTAKMNCDFLTVLVSVSPDDPYTFFQRKTWIIKCLSKLNFVSYNIIKQKEFDKNTEKDQHGTIIDEEYWEIWLEDTKRLLKDRKTSIVFTSDLYGRRIAEELDASWLPVDPNREIFRISGTKIRENFYNNSNYLPKYVLDSFTKKIALVGPESVGKSFSALALARNYYTEYVPEYGRTLAESKNNELDKIDFMNIYKVQRSFVTQFMYYIDHPLLFLDSETITTDIWFRYFFNEDSPPNRTICFADFYLLLTPEVPFIQDGTRMTDEITRWKMFHQIKNELEKRNLPYVVISGDSYGQRLENMNLEVKNYINKTFNLR